MEPSQLLIAPFLNDIFLHWTVNWSQVQSPSFHLCQITVSIHRLLISAQRVSVFNI